MESLVLYCVVGAGVPASHVGKEGREPVLLSACLRHLRPRLFNHHQGAHGLLNHAREDRQVGHVFISAS